MSGQADHSRDQTLVEGGPQEGQGRGVRDVWNPWSLSGRRTACVRAWSCLDTPHATFVAMCTGRRCPHALPQASHIMRTLSAVSPSHIGACLAVSRKQVHTRRRRAISIESPSLIGKGLRADGRRKRPISSQGPAHVPDAAAVVHTCRRHPRPRGRGHPTDMSSTRRPSLPLWRPTRMRPNGPRACCPPRDRSALGVCGENFSHGTHRRST